MAEATPHGDVTREDAAVEVQPALVVSKADPAPLGFAAFALTMFVLSFTNAGLIGSSSVEVVVALALAYGGLAEVLAGMWEFRNGNTFGATAFTSFGAFWLSYAALVFLLAPHVAKGDAPGALGTFLLAWGIFTTYMFVATLRQAWPVMVVFALLAITLYLLAVGEYQSNSSVTNWGGYLGIVTAIAAWYASASSIINESFGRRILPR